MGYCSDVAIIIQVKVVGRFQQIIGNYYTEERELSYFWNRCKQQLDSENGDVIYYWRYIKWNRGCPEVDIFERFMEQLDNENLSEKYLFVRAGEEWEDIEYRGNYEDEDGENPFGLEVEREITFFGKHTD